MIEAWLEWGIVDQIFVLCAVVGSSLFVIRTAMMLIGADLDHDVDFDHDIGAHADTDIDFKLLTIQGIMGFLMMFGLVGLMLKRGFMLHYFIAIIGATIAGSFTLWATAKAMSWMKDLESSGNIDEKNCIGKEGEVYLTIPKGGVGKIHVIVQKRLVEYDAESNDDEDVKTGTQIRVVFKKGNNFIVERL